MSVTVEFLDIDGGDNLKIVVQYDYGDYLLKQLTVTCPIIAENHARSFIKILEEDREKFSGQQKIKFKDFLTESNKKKYITGIK